MKRPRFFLLLAGLLGLSCAPEPTASLAAEPFPFETLHALIRPHDGEDPWATIPWRTSLWEARREAAAAGKPILLWEMDGHPLGCT